MLTNKIEKKTWFSKIHILNIWGNVLLLFGILLSFGSFKVDNIVMGDANLGYGLFADDKNSPQWAKQKCLRNIGDGILVLGCFCSDKRPPTIGG